MVLTHAERARAVVQYLAGQTGKKQHEIGQLVGFNNRSAFSQILNGHKGMPKTMPERLSSLDPRINILFLTGESDDMLLPAPGGPETPRISTQTPSGDKSSTRTTNEPENGIFIPTELVQMITDLSTTIKDQQKMITLLVEKWAHNQ